MWRYPNREKRIWPSAGSESRSRMKLWSGQKVVILAIPDRAIQAVSREVVPRLRPGTMVFGLDPAAAHAGVMPDRGDITYFVAHPCHPPLFGDRAPAGPETDWFGGRDAAQSVVCALYQGPEEDYQVGEQLAAALFAPILRMHRISVEHMALLEPAVVESTCICCVMVMKILDPEAIRRSVRDITHAVA